MNLNLHWGIVGAGDVCERKGGPPLYQLPGHHLEAVTRRNVAAGEDFALRHGPCRYVPTLDALLALPEINAVYVATPPALHCEQTLAAAAAGKHVLVEKPMAMDANECARMVEACQDAGVLLAVAYYRRCYPSILRAKALLEAGAIGTLEELELNDQFPISHRMDLAHFFCGPMATLHAETETLPPGSHQSEGLRLHARSVNGVSVVTNLGWRESGPPEQLTLRGSGGSIFVNDLKGGSLILRDANGTHNETFAPLPWTHWGLVENLGLHLSDGTSLACDGAEGRRSTVVLDFASILVPGAPPITVDYQHPPNLDKHRAAGLHLLA